VDGVCDNVTVDIFNGRNGRLFRCLFSQSLAAAGSAHARRRRNAKRIRAESPMRLCSRNVSRSPSDCSLRELHAHTITFSATTVPAMMHAAQPRQMELSPTQKASSLGRHIARAGALPRSGSYKARIIKRSFKRTSRAHVRAVEAAGRTWTRQRALPAARPSDDRESCEKTDACTFRVSNLIQI